MNRRGFLKGILAAGVAPAVLPSGIIMPVRKLWTPLDGFSNGDVFTVAWAYGYIDGMLYARRVQAKEYFEFANGDLLIGGVNVVEEEVSGEGYAA